MQSKALAKSRNTAPTTFPSPIAFSHKSVTLNKHPAQDKNQIFFVERRSYLSKWPTIVSKTSRSKVFETTGKTDSYIAIG